MYVLKTYRFNRNKWNKFWAPSNQRFRLSVCQANNGNENHKGNNGEAVRAIRTKRDYLILYVGEEFARSLPIEIKHVSYSCDSTIYTEINLLLRRDGRTKCG